jgi:hypothetical protein
VWKRSVELRRYAVVGAMEVEAVRKRVGRCRQVGREARAREAWSGRLPCPRPIGADGVGGGAVCAERVHGTSEREARLQAATRRDCR